MYQPPQGSGQAQALRDQGIAALQAGDKARARELLDQAALLNPSDEHAWLWLSGAVDNLEERRRCLEQVLALNPNNSAARRGLADMPSAAQPAYQPAAYQPAAHQPAAYQPAAHQPAAYQTASEAAPGAYPAATGYQQGGYAAPPAAYDPYGPGTQTGRPGCITCLALLSFAGALLLGLFVILISGAIQLPPEINQGIGNALYSEGIPQGLIIVVATGIAVLYAVTGIGLFSGASWGWWLAAILEAFSIVRPPLTLVSLASTGDLPQQPGLAVGSALVDIVIPLLILIYLFTPRVWGYFGLHATSKSTAGGIVFAVGFLLAVAFVSLTLFVSV